MGVRFPQWSSGLCLSLYIYLRGDVLTPEYISFIYSVESALYFVIMLVITLYLITYYSCYNAIIYLVDCYMVL